MPWSGGWTIRPSGASLDKDKRNHWVSQSYLRSFAADADKRQKTWRFSKDNGEPELKPIAKVARAPPPLRSKRSGWQAGL
jgi:hypothetical protein